MTVHALGGGTLIVCLADIADTGAEKLGHGIAEWQAELDPPGQTTLYFKDEGFASACAKANLAAILRQRMLATRMCLPATISRSCGAG